MGTFKVIYITGAPASGKTKATRALQSSGKSIDIWGYGERLQAYLTERERSADYAELRAQSSAIVTAEDIATVDRRLIAFVSDRRAHTNVIIDSHPVTKETYGFRVTAFSLDHLAALSPDEIWMTYSSPAETVARITANPEGRPLVDEAQAAMHTSLQAAVATNYGILTGRPVYFFDTELGPEVWTTTMLSRLV